MPSFRRAQPGTPPSNLPPDKWQGWKTQTGPTIADVEQSRQSLSVEQESEMPDPELREAMARSLQEISHDPHETPNTGGASGSGGDARTTPYQGAASAQSGTPNTQSDGEGSVLPNRPPRIFAGDNVPQLVPRPMTTEEQRIVLEDRMKGKRLKSRQVWIR